MKTDIEERFRANLSRVDDLVTLYLRISGGEKGTPSVEESDILRAAVVLLHATLEELLRGLAHWKLPGADAHVLKEIPLVGAPDPRKTNFTLGELAAHRGQRVDEVIQKSVVHWLARSNYNDARDVISQLQRLAIKTTDLVEPYMADLAALMSRRHLIAHQLDRDDSQGRGRHQARSLSKTSVDHWRRSVEDFGTRVLATC